MAEAEKVMYIVVVDDGDKTEKGNESFRSKKIVISISGYPSESLKKLVKFKGWQVLVIGELQNVVELEPQRVWVTCL
ncbi:hypothetical protein ACFX2I_030223 [Malus domestica]